MLRLLAAAPLLASPAAAALAPARGLSPAQQRLSELGRRLAEENPEAADGLLAFATRQAARSGLNAVRRRDVDRICAALLDGWRIAAEFRDGLVHAADGWLLARSEASACVYLHRMASRSDGGA